MSETLQEFIRRYVCLKIQSGDWKVGSKILSENQIALKFSCSRLSARQALQPLIYGGILEVRKGMGYTVSNRVGDMSLLSFSEKHNIDETTLELIEPTDEYKELLGVEGLRNIILFRKGYFKDKRLVSVQITCLNRDLFWEFDADSFNESMTVALSRQGVLLIRGFSEIKITNHHLLLNEAQRLGWGDDYIVEKVSTSSIDGEIEKTIRVTDRKLFNFKFVKFSI